MVMELPEDRPCRSGGLQPRHTAAGRRLLRPPEVKHDLIVRIQYVFHFLTYSDRIGASRSTSESFGYKGCRGLRQHRRLRFVVSGLRRHVAQNFTHADD